MTGRIRDIAAFCTTAAAAVILTVIPVPDCYAREPDSYASPFPVQQTFRYALGRNNGTGFEPFRNTAQFTYTFDIPQVSARTGIQLTSDTFDFTADAIWWFARGSKIRTGIGMLYHYLLYEQISATDDFMAGLCMDFHPFTLFSISMDLDFQYKMDQVFAVKSHTPWLRNYNPAFRFRMTYAFDSGAEIYAETASYEYFRYMLFFAPSFTFGGLYRWKNGMWLGAEIIPRYIDMMTLSADYDCTEIRAYYGFRF